MNAVRKITGFPVFFRIGFPDVFDAYDACVFGIHTPSGKECTIGGWDATAVHLEPLAAGVASPRLPRVAYIRLKLVQN